MSDTNNTAKVVRRFVEEYQGTGDEEVALALMAPDFVDRSPFGPFAPDREGVLGLFRMLRGGFPDLHAEIHDQLVDGDKVVTRKTFRGTHEGELLGIPPTGRGVAWDVIDIVRVRGDLIVEHWNVVDSMALMTQLGAVPGAA
jgi:predicted SnoaL-like aldol condensation-catalyzing enzyme